MKQALMDSGNLDGGGFTTVAPKPVYIAPPVFNEIYTPVLEKLDVPTRNVGSAKEGYIEQPVISVNKPVDQMINTFKVPDVFVNPLLDQKVDDHKLNSDIRDRSGETKVDAPLTSQQVDQVFESVKANVTTSQTTTEIYSPKIEEPVKIENYIDLLPPNKINEVIRDVVTVIQEDRFGNEEKVVDLFTTKPDVNKEVTIILSSNDTVKLVNESVRSGGSLPASSVGSGNIGLFDLNTDLIDTSVLTKNLIKPSSGLLGFGIIGLILLFVVIK